MKTVKWIKNGPGVGYSYFFGDIAVVPDAEAVKLRNGGYVLIVPDVTDAVPVHNTMITNAHTPVFYKENRNNRYR